MAYIIHHNDDDGRCSAAVIYNEIFGGLPMDESSFIEYGHTAEGINLKIEDIKQNDIIFIVDLALDEVVYNFISKVVRCAQDVQIIHIDHHKTTLEFIEHMNDEQREIMQHVRKLYKIGVSASMLCWTYACMNETERKKCESMVYDYTESYSHVGISEDGTMDHLREYRVPMIVRFIDDWDVWRHAMPTTKAFNLGFSMVENKQPYDALWKDLLYGQDFRLNKMFVEPGQIIQQYKNAENRRVMKNAFEFSFKNSELFERFGDYKMLCLNHTTHSSIVFGDKVKEYDAVCVFHYDGGNKQWRYSLYSDEEKGIDVSGICKAFGGGGHEHAAAFYSSPDDDCMF